MGFLHKPVIFFVSHFFSAVSRVGATHPLHNAAQTGFALEFKSIDVTTFELGNSGQSPMSVCHACDQYPELRAAHMSKYSSEICTRAPSRMNDVFT